MNAPISQPLSVATPWAEEKKECLLWQARCLNAFSQVEHEIALALNLFDHAGEADPTKRLTILVGLLESSGDKVRKKLAALLNDWAKRKAIRNMLAHGTLQVLQDDKAEYAVLMRHVSVNAVYDYADRLWREDERNALLRSLKADAQSICDRLRNLKADTAQLKAESA